MRDVLGDKVVPGDEVLLATSQKHRLSRGRVLLVEAGFVVVQNKGSFVRRAPILRINPPLPIESFPREPLMYDFEGRQIARGDTIVYAKTINGAPGFLVLEVVGQGLGMFNRLFPVAIRRQHSTYLLRRPA